MARIAARGLGGGLAETILGPLSDKALGNERKAFRSAFNAAHIALKIKLSKVKGLHRMS